MEHKRFAKNVENFRCLHCETEVRGNGYTNHCPECLWSKHVDINPGDRAHACKGSMEPVAVIVRSGTYTLVHRCTQCSAVRQIRTSSDDNFDELLILASSPKIHFLERAS